MKKIITLLLLTLGIFGLIGCGKKEESKVDTSETDMLASTEVPLEKNPIKIEDIDWSVEPMLIDGANVVSFNYTNNSEYTIADVELKFKQKEGVTPEQLSAFSYLKEDELLPWTDEEIAEVYVTGYNRKVAEPGETVTTSPVVLKNSYSRIKDMSEYDIMEPESISIAYIHGKKAYVEYYDFLTQTYGESTEGGKSIQTWSDSKIAKQLPKIKSPVITIEDDEKNIFSFKAYGVTREGFEGYVKEIQDTGFDGTLKEGSGVYNASGDGYAVEIYFDSIEEMIKCTIETADADSWADTELGKKIPKPSSDSIKITIDSDSMLSFEIVGLTEDEFVAYVNECKDAGFVDISSDDNNWFNAKDGDGYGVMLSYRPDTLLLDGTITAP